MFTAACSSDDGDDTPTSGGTTDAGALGPVAQATGEPVKIGVISDGQSAAIDNSIQFYVADATAAYFNEHRSGIGGRP
nr:hypothetical protein [Micromonospora sp. DSM 115978]